MLPTSISSASSIRLPSLRVAASGLSFHAGPNQSFTVPPGTQVVFDLPKLNMAQVAIQRDQAPQRFFGDQQWTMPPNPAPQAVEPRGGPLFKPSIVVPVAIIDPAGNVHAGELTASTVGARASVEAVYAEASAAITAMMQAGQDAVAVATFTGMSAVSMGQGNSYRVGFTDVKAIEAPAAVVAFRTQFAALIELAKRTPITLPQAPAAPAGFLPQAMAPMGFAPQQVAAVNPFAAAVAAPVAAAPAVAPVNPFAAAAPAAPAAPQFSVPQAPRVG